MRRRRRRRTFLLLLLLDMGDRYIERTPRINT